VKLDGFIIGITDAEIRREKAKARELRQSRWWRNRISSGRCHWCNASFPPEELTMDHVIPLVRGGKSTRNNLVPCCKECNSRKKFLLPMEWEEYLKKHGASGA